MKVIILVLLCFLSLTTNNFSQVLLNVNFSGSFPPAGWTRDSLTEHWSKWESSFAGGTMPEVAFYVDANPIGGVSHMISPVINTTGLTHLRLTFRHMYDRVVTTPQVTIGIATRSGNSAGAWQTVWSKNPLSDIPPTLENIIISNSDVGSPDFQICMFVQGNIINNVGWFIDDFVLQNTLQHDIVIKQLIVDSLCYPGSAITPLIRISNAGCNQETFTITGIIKCNGINVYSQTSSSFTLAQGQEQLFTLPEYLIEINHQVYYITVTANLPEDEDTSSNQMMKSFRSIDRDTTNWFPYSVGDSLHVQTIHTDLGYQDIQYNKSVVTAVQNDTLQYLQVHGVPYYYDKLQQRLYTIKNNQKVVAVDFNTLMGGSFYGTVNNHPRGTYKRIVYSNFAASRDSIETSPSWHLMKYSMIFTENKGATKFSNGGQNAYGDPFNYDYNVIEGKGQNFSFTFSQPTFSVAPISPTRDKNAFPYTITFSKTHPYPVLIDSIFATIDLYRNDNLLLSKVQPYTTNYFYIAFPFPLEYGDIIKLKFVLTDNALFKNRITVPQNGTIDIFITYNTYPLNAFNLTAPAAGARITTFPNNFTPVTFSWDTSSSTASYKWTFYSPSGTPRLVVNTAVNNLTFTSGQLDNLLAGIGVNHGDSIAGTWNVMAYRNSVPQDDSLTAANGPRTITLKRWKPLLTAFNLNTPENGSTIITSTFDSSPVTFNWRKSGDGVKYKVKWGSTLTNLMIESFSDNSGFDTSWTVANNALDLMLQNSGFPDGDSLTGQYAVYAYSGMDSLKSISTFDLKIKRLIKGWLVAYDYSTVNGRATLDSVAYWMNKMGRAFDAYDRHYISSSLSFRGYRGVLWLGSNSSIMSSIQKDSIKSYLLSGGTTFETKSKLIIFSEDIGYEFDRPSTLSYDSAFAHGFLGWEYSANFPGSTYSPRGIIGDIINNGLIDSTVNTSPDELRPSWRGADRLYKFRITPGSSNSGNAFGMTNQPTYNVATFGTDVNALRNASDGQPGSAVYRLLSGAINYVMPIPVELTSFSAAVNKDEVNLLWVTSTETNNFGYVIERNSGSGFREIGFVRGKGTTVEMQTYTFRDKVKEGTYTYRLKQADYDGTTKYSKEIEIEVSILPSMYALEQNYPNPFNPSTVIKYSIPNDGLVTLQVYNVLGERVMTLVNQIMKAGKYEVTFNASELASGIYLYKLDSGNFSSVKKIMLIK